MNLVIGEEVADGWHAARLVQEHPNLDYFIQSVAARGPFRITRPWRGANGSVEPAAPMPDLGAVSRSLSITWDWMPQPEGSLMLPIFIRRTRTGWLRRTRSMKVRLVLKHMTIKGSVVHLKIASKPVQWTRRVPWAAA